MLVLRSLLFVPSHRDNMVQRAHQTDADVVVLDLEDGVPPAEKDVARAGLRAAIVSLKAAGKTVHVRVNHHDTGLTAADLDAAICPELDGVAFPKTEGSRDVRRLDVLLRQRELHAGVKPGSIVLIPHIETALGVLRCEEIVGASTRIAGLSLGSYDYAADLGVERTTAGVELEHARRVIVTVCAAYRLQALDGPLADFVDLNGLITESQYARSLGFKGKYVIHPNQVGPVNAAFAPRAAELDLARRMIAAFDTGVAEGRGAVQVDGKMVDAPVARRARDLIAYAEAIEGRPVRAGFP